MAISPMYDWHTRRRFLEETARYVEPQEPGAWPDNSDFPVGYDERDSKGV